MLPNTSKKLVHIAGDTKISEKVARDARGNVVMEQSIHLNSKAIGHPIVLYKDRSGVEYVLTLDVYKFAGEPMKVHLICPRCSERGQENALTVNEGQKRIEYDPKAPMTMTLNNEDGRPVLTDLGGQISIERFTCTWEFDITAEVARNAGFVRGNNLCGWTVEIIRNIAKDA